jgi:hypothetical protein
MRKNSDDLLDWLRTAFCSAPNFSKLVIMLLVGPMAKLRRLREELQKSHFEPLMERSLDAHDRNPDSDFFLLAFYQRQISG